MKDGWFKFDTVLVIMIVLETWLIPLSVVLVGLQGADFRTGPIRLLRLLRLSRWARLVRSLPELVTMLKGMLVASRAVASSLLMVISLIYFFSILLFTLLKDEPDTQHFSSILSCMWTLLMDGTFMYNPGIVTDTLIERGTPTGYLAIAVFLVFVFMSAMTVMNMLIGVLCEVVTTVAQERRTDNDLRNLKDTILEKVLLNYSEGNNISKSELVHMMEDVQSRVLLQELRIDVKFMNEAIRMLIDEKFSTSCDNIPIKYIMSLMLSCRGDVPVTFRHLADSHFFTRWMVRTEVDGLLAPGRAQLSDIREKLEKVMWCLGQRCPSRDAKQHKGD